MLSPIPEGRSCTSGSPFQGWGKEDNNNLVQNILINFIQK